ncbi:MAG: hypothetical protein H8E18_02220 [FCB group bacterium]|nr:hypothetical protein [FCB group bacterium]
MRLQRAISKLLTDNIPGLNAFKDDIAFVAAGNPYPYFLVDLISTRKQTLGTGLWDKFQTSEDSTAQVKVTKHQQVLRFTVRAVNDSGRNGNDILFEICDKIDDFLSNLCCEGSVNIADALSPDAVHIENILFQGRSDMTPIEKGMPFVYQQSLSYLFVEHRYKTRIVENKIESIKIEI